METITLATVNGTRTVYLADIMATLPHVHVTRIEAARNSMQPYQFCVTLDNGWTFSFNTDTIMTRQLLADCVQNVAAFA